MYEFKEEFGRNFVVFVRLVEGQEVVLDYLCVDVLVG